MTRGAVVVVRPRRSRPVTIAPSPLWQESRWHPECEQRAHPPVTFNPWYGLWWCACGHTVKPGSPTDHWDHWTCTHTPEPETLF